MKSSSTSDRPVVIVTGAGKGLGRAFALASARKGFAVVVNNRQRAGAEDSAASVVEEITSAGGQAVVEYSDVTLPGASEAIVNTAIGHFGRLDAVVFNAGTNGDPARFAKTPDAAFEQVMNLNFTSQVQLARAALPYLEQSEAGRLVFVASSAGLYGVYGLTPYSASKGALIAFSSALAAEYRKSKLRVNVVAPYADTRMTEGHFSGDALLQFTPEAAAAPTVWLASRECQETGTVWVVGGGWIRRACTMESFGRPFEDVIDDAQAFQDLASMRGAETFPNAEAAFSGFHTMVTKGQAVNPGGET